MQRLIVVLFLQLGFFSLLSGQTKISKNLMMEIGRALESHEYVDAVVQLQHKVSISEYQTTHTAQTVNQSSELLHISHNSEMINWIESRSEQEVLFVDGPNINGKLYMKAIPAVFFELEKYQAVLSMDMAGFLSNADPTLQSPAEIPSHFQPIEWGTTIYQGSASPTGSPYVAYRGTIEIKEIPWLRLYFSEANLGNASYIEITSLKDGGMQRLNQEQLGQWQYTSAYFNGEAVTIELFVDPADSDIFCVWSR